MSAQAPKPLKAGTIVSVAFPSRDPRGQEMEGLHPAVILGTVHARLDLAWVVPITSDRGYAWIDAHPHLYLRLPRGTGGLDGDSVLLVDQVQAVDMRRLRRAFGALPAEVLGRARQAIASILGLPKGVPHGR